MSRNALVLHKFPYKPALESGTCFSDSFTSRPIPPKECQRQMPNFASIQSPISLFSSKSSFLDLPGEFVQYHPWTLTIADPKIQPTKKRTTTMKSMAKKEMTCACVLEAVCSKLMVEVWSVRLGEINGSWVQARCEKLEAPWDFGFIFQGLGCAMVIVSRWFSGLVPTLNRDIDSQAKLKWYSGRQQSFGIASVSGKYPGHSIVSAFRFTKHLM